MKKELEGLILKLTTEFENTITEEENKKTEIVVAFKNYLYLAVETIQESTSKFISRDLESIKSALNSISNDFKQKDLESIKRILLVDDAFEEIRKKSLEIFKIAQNCMSGNGKVAEIDIENEIKNMDNLFKNVKGYNQKQAKELISEAIVDLKYISHQDERNLSLRLYQFKKRANRIEEER